MAASNKIRLMNPVSVWCDVCQNYMPVSIDLDLLLKYNNYKYRTGAALRIWVKLRCPKCRQILYDFTAQDGDTHGN